MDNIQPNPFETVLRCTSNILSLLLLHSIYFLGISKNKIWLELAQGDEKRLGDLTVVANNDLSPALLITQGLELEEHQYVTLADY